MPNRVLFQQTTTAHCTGGTEDPTHYFGEQVFNDYVMRTRLSSETYHSLKETIDAGEPLDSSIAGEVAAAMKQWRWNVEQLTIPLVSCR